MLESPTNKHLTGGRLTNPTQIILASGSPRRRELLALGGWTFEIIPAEVDETPHDGEAPADYVLRLAEAKARAIAAETADGRLILAADTTVADGTLILGKPADAQEAHQMLKSLRGRAHQVFTAIALYLPDKDRLITDLAETTVPMRDYSDAEIEAYIQTGDPFDKAGAYAIQHPEFKPVEHLEGCYANVVGLPLCHLARGLAEFGLQPQSNLPQACQNRLNFDCPVHQKILRGIV
jgi:MAF protein